MSEQKRDASTLFCFFRRYCVAIEQISYLFYYT